MRKISAILLIASMVAMPVISNAYDDGDFQVWLKGSVKGKIADGLSVKIEEELKIGDSASEQYDEETLLLATYSAMDWLKIGLGYRVVQERKNKTVVTPKTAADGTVTYSKVGDGDHYWRNEQRPTGELTFHRKIAGWKLEDRTRFEWRMKDDGKDDYLRFRNRLKVKSPWKFTALSINPYVAWEAFYENMDGLSGSDKWNRHRCYAGLSAKFSEHLKGGLYYMLQTDRDGDGWRKYNVAGLEIGASF